MTLPQNTKSYLWGAAGGAIALATLGFTWGGWVTGGTARKESAAAAHDAVVAALAPICVEQFRAQTDSSGKLSALQKASSWERGNIVEKSGYATMPGTSSTDIDVARACAELLVTPPKGKS